MKLLLTTAFTILINLQSFASESALPETLPLEYLTKQGFVEFSQAPGTFRAPYAAAIVLNGTPVNGPSSGETLDLIFRDRFYANLPDGFSIQASFDSLRREVWGFPAFSEIVHLIEFNADPSRLRNSSGGRDFFELRMVRKQIDGTWAFGLYVPDRDQKVWVLQNYSGLKDASFKINLRKIGESSLTLKRVNLLSCRNCHFMQSPSSYQYPTRDSAGPCGFGPHNLKIKTDWSDAFYKAKGYRPF